MSEKEAVFATGFARDWSSVMQLRLCHESRCCNWKCSTGEESTGGPVNPYFPVLAVALLICRNLISP